MTPALSILNARGRRLGLREPWQFFWASGLLSSFLDNAPTYLAVHGGRVGDRNRSPYRAAILVMDSGSDPSSAYEHVLAAISCGCVFMGALDLHWEWAELHDPGHRPGVQYPHAELSRLHGVFGVDTPSALCTCDDSLLSRVTLPNVTCFRRNRSCLE